MTDDQKDAIRSLIVAAQVASMLARAMWYVVKKDSHFEAALIEIQARLDAAVEVVQKALKTAPGGNDAVIH